MAREHVEFIQAQALSWRGGYLDGAREDVEVKVLSEDGESGACSILIRYPEGWSLDGARHTTVDEEFMVLDGALEINGRTYDLDCYADLPAGFEWASASAPGGAVVLAFFDARPNTGSGAAPEGTYDAPGGTVFADTHDMPWHCEGMDPAYGEIGLRWKILRHDEAAKDATFLVMTPPQFHPEAWKGPQETHDCVEEMYLIGGDFLSNVGVMRGGAYFWRPPGILHGPYGSRAGNLTLIRTLGGDLENNWSEHQTAISKTPAYKPYLPDNMKQAGGKEWRPDPAY